MCVYHHRAPFRGKRENSLTERFTEMAQETLRNPESKKYALVTGANKGIGFEICKQLALNGIMVVLTARDEKRGIEALEKLKPSDNVIFHQLDVVDPNSVASLADFIKTNYGRLDILVNNAGILGAGIKGDPSILEEVIIVDAESTLLGAKPGSVELKSSGKLIETLEEAELCIQTNYYGAKRMVEHFIPLLQASDSPRIVNVSSALGNLKLLTNEWAQSVLSDVESLTESKIDEVIRRLLQDFGDGGGGDSSAAANNNQWPAYLRAYKVSKACLNSYTRLMARKYPDICINCVCPGYTRTDITRSFGVLSAEEAAESPVRLALMQDKGCCSGLFFLRKEVWSF